MSDLNSSYEAPRWVRDLVRFLHLKPQFVLSGNVRDYQLTRAAGGQVTAMPLVSVLAKELIDDGYTAVLSYDPVNGFQAVPGPGQDLSVAAAALTSVGLTPGANGKAAASLDLFAETLERLVTAPGGPVALVADFASRLLSRADHLSPAEHAAFTRALVLSHQAAAKPVGEPARRFWNTVVWIAEKEGDLPDWFLVGNPKVRHIPVAKPDSRTRRTLAPSLLRRLDGFRTATEQDAKSALDAFVDQTEGLLLLDMMAIVDLGRSEGVPFSSVGDAVRRYKVGVTEDPWSRIPLEKVRGGDEFLRSRVRGQDHAVTHILDIVKRAVTGVGAPRRGNRPRGVAFLAGPTGVGKTELAKTLTRLLFGDEGAYIRFDMSEFSAEHSDQRLIGAPPGYVGYDVGGELTNAIREKPFSVVLFDEIEKAHPRILDKFLQILDDGVLTSGRGDRVYFSESFIIFTSNLGIFRSEVDGSRVANVTPDDPFEHVRTQVRSEIERHFKLTLNRPEILNRIGDNVLVFDFIRRDVANDIFDMMVADVLRDAVPSRDVTVSIAQDALEALRELCLADLSNGGRGIRNKVETHLINPLARALFDLGSLSDVTVRIERVFSRPDGVTALELARA
ncbi:AAA family ATPase [Falsiroseomonas sp. HW251]|uniref:AAA family ATPase n=1 Tax=Falsiroseomonas sp. HW251 TaxID=3390998 RepID=UPI003D323E0C